MVKRMYGRAKRPDLLAGLSNDVFPISNVECLCSMKRELITPQFKGLPGVQSAISCLKPNSASAPIPCRFPVLPPISQIDVLSSKMSGSSEFDDRTIMKSRISNVTCLNADELEKDSFFSTELPSGRIAKKDFGIKPHDSEFVRLCKMNGRKNLLKDVEILERQTAAPRARDFEMTKKRTMLPSTNESWKPSAWVKFGMYEKSQNR